LTKVVSGESNPERRVADSMVYSTQMNPFVNILIKEENDDEDGEKIDEEEVKEVSDKEETTQPRIPCPSMDRRSMMSQEQSSRRQSISNLYGVKP
jgi:hypothetical protein